MADALLFPPTNPHFFQPFCPGFQSHLNIPVKFFCEHIEGKHVGKTVKLRSDMSERTWKVKIEGHRLTNGWKDFVEAHSLRTGDFVVFRHEEDLLFHVTALGPSFCEIQYAPSGSRNEEEEMSDETAEISSGSEKEVEENQTTKSKSSSFYFNCFSQFVTASNISRDCVGVPTAFAKRNGLNKANQEMVLMNEEGKSWPSELKILVSCRIVIVRGWTSFCTANKLEAGDSCTFRLLGNTENPVFRLCSCTKAKKSQSAEESMADRTRENRFAMLTPTHNSLGKQMEQSPLEAEAREHKRARVQNWSQETRPKLETRGNAAADEEPSHRTRASNKSSASQGNLQEKQASSVSYQLAKVKQSVVDTLTSIRGFRAKLETMEKKLEDSVQELHNLKRGEDNGNKTTTSSNNNNQI